ncbi:MAG: DNA adenine methylase [Candidatus Aenigmatarchaeota archaeon]
MLKYIGSKRVLIDFILDVINIISDSLINKNKNQIRVLDGFAGSCRVSYRLKQEGYYVIAGDYLNFVYHNIRTFVVADRKDYPPEIVNPIISNLNKINSKECNDCWFRDLYSIQSKYFHPDNALKIDLIRREIEKYQDELLKSILITSLLHAADKVDSTTGVQMAYLKNLADRAYKPLILEYPDLLYGTGEAILGDITEWITEVKDIDIAYFDPPYNSHSYLGNYHIWETLTLYDNPEVYGVAKKRIDVKKRKSKFNYKKDSYNTLSYIINKVNAKHIVLSFNNEGFFTKEDLLKICKTRGYVIYVSKQHKRYIGSVIGIYNPQGNKVGKVSHTKNEEYLFIITSTKDDYKDLVNAMKSKNYNITQNT